MVDNDIFTPSNDFVYKIGDKYKQPTIGYSEWMLKNYDEEMYCGKRYYDTTVRYTSNNGIMILELNENIDYGDGTFDTSIFTGKEIKEILPDFDGDDNIGYCVLDDNNMLFY